MNEEEFGYRIRQRLDEGAARLDLRTLMRLAQGRRAALDHFDGREPAAQPVLVGAGPGDVFAGLSGRLRRLGMLVPIALLAIGFIGIDHWQHARSIEDAAAMDLAVLLDEEPLETYSDHGFGELLRGEHPAAER